ncbi:MAG: hypothetical protein JWN18_455 [Parcubacteria group bacterium]|nr:hypothetical protein [Parcubacteria group bacterium]
MRLYARSLTLIGGGVWLVVMAYGEFWGGAPNSACYPYLGCDEGFFGYDALEHFLFGLTLVWLIVWLSDTYPRLSLLHSEFWKTVLTILAVIALVAVIWEIGEWFRDAYLLGIAHQPLLNIRLHINYLAQPSNFDTMGDLSFTLTAACISLLLLLL